MWFDRGCPVDPLGVLFNKTTMKKYYPLGFTLLMVTLILWGGCTIFKYESDLRHQERMKYLRDSYSPMSDDEEIQRAYDEVR